MIQDKQEKEDKHGKPWKVVGKFDDFKGADILRKGIELEASDSLDVKVKKLACNFVVKVRDKDVSDIPREKKPRKKFKKGKKGKK
tara:strand:+ start:226 stop:480 length:255 start_codon:yes stop_codon:yes gene_type:complete